jgi:hypothetical protein
MQGDRSKCKWLVCCEIMGVPLCRWWVNAGPNRRKVESFEDHHGRNTWVAAKESLENFKTIRLNIDSFLLYEHEGKLNVHARHE